MTDDWCWEAFATSEQTRSHANNPTRPHIANSKTLNKGVGDWDDREDNVLPWITTHMLTFLTSTLRTRPVSLAKSKFTDSDADPSDSNDPNDPNKPKKLAAVRVEHAWTGVIG